MRLGGAGIYPISYLLQEGSRQIPTEAAGRHHQRRGLERRDGGGSGGRPLAGGARGAGMWVQSGVFYVYMCKYIYIYVFICICIYISMYVFIYIYVLKARQRRIERFGAPLHRLELETRVVSVCLVFFQGVERDKGGSTATIDYQTIPKPSFW